MVPQPDTIAAIATAPGPGALATVRISGGSATSILRRVAPGMTWPVPARTASLAEIRHPGTGEVLDQVVVVRFSAPASYTGI